MKILFCSSEVVPYAKTGGLADVSGALPCALSELGHKVNIVMPRYRQIGIKKFNLDKAGDDIYRTDLDKGVEVYFIDSRKFFDREGIYVSRNGVYKDNLQRFAFFCRRTLEWTKEVGFRPDIVHCNDWQTALMIVYLKTIYRNDPFFSKTKTLLTIHNLGYQGVFAASKFNKLKIPRSLLDPGQIKHKRKINLLKGGIVFADMINVVSPAYAREIQIKKFSFGLERALRRRKRSISGVLNVLDYGVWDPAGDSRIPSRYSFSKIGRKQVNKKHLIKKCNLRIGPDMPLLGMVSRLVIQKGLDILIPALNKALAYNLGVVILGEGEARYHKGLKALMSKYRGKIAVYLKFDERLAHNIYAASDVFLMPSHYEPCGLSQMISLKYGTLPLVFKTGGLADTVNKNNGFVFKNYSSAGMLRAIYKAWSAYRDKKAWRRLMKNAMNCNFSWRHSAAEYVRLYRKVADA